MIIRKIQRRDAVEVLKLRRETFENINAKNLSKEAMEEISKMNTLDRLLKKIKERDMFCFCNGAGILGVISLEGNEIGSVFVRYDLVRNGLGRKMMAFIENYAKRQKVHEVRLNSSEYARDFYLKVGYTEKNRMEYPSGVINFLMEKRI